jgi:hypothetical protein
MVLLLAAQGISRDSDLSEKPTLTMQKNQLAWQPSLLIQTALPSLPCFDVGEAFK